MISKCYPSQLPLLFFISDFQCFPPGVTNCLPGTFLVSTTKIPTLRKPLCPWRTGKAVYPNCSRRTLKKKKWWSGNTFFTLLSPIAVSSWRFFYFLSNPCSEWSIWPPQESSISCLSSPPTTLFKTNFPDLLSVLSGWSKPSIISVCAIRDICLPRHLHVHIKK